MANVTLETFRTMAQDLAVNGASREKTVLHLDETGTSVKGLGWRRLTTRDGDFKNQNLATRQALVDAIKRELNGFSLENLPPDIAKLLKVSDFKLDKQGKVTSKMPLTARRVIAITAAIGKLKELRTFANGAVPGNALSHLAQTMAAKVDGAKFQGLTEIKLHHAKIAIDLMAAVHENGVVLPQGGTRIERFKAFVRNVGEAVGSRYGVIINNLNQTIRRGVENESTARYGRHMMGGDDTGKVARAMAVLLKDMMPGIGELVKKIGKADLGQLAEQITDNDLIPAQERAADEQFKLAQTVQKLEQTRANDSLSTDEKEQRIEMLETKHRQIEERLDAIAQKRNEVDFAVALTGAFLQIYS